jgi:hypothetical protein
VNCGPRTVNGNNWPWNVNTNIGARFACEYFTVLRLRLRTGDLVSYAPLLFY